MSRFSFRSRRASHRRALAKRRRETLCASWQELHDLRLEMKARLPDHAARRAKKRALLQRARSLETSLAKRASPALVAAAFRVHLPAVVGFLGTEALPLGATGRAMAAALVEKPALDALERTRPTLAHPAVAERIATSARPLLDVCAVLAPPRSGLPWPGRTLVAPAYECVVEVALLNGRSLLASGRLADYSCDGELNEALARLEFDDKRIVVLETDQNYGESFVYTDDTAAEYDERFVQRTFHVGSVKATLVRPDGRVLCLFSGEVPMWPDGGYWENDDWMPDFEVPVGGDLEHMGDAHSICHSGAAIFTTDCETTVTGDHVFRAKGLLLKFVCLREQREFDSYEWKYTEMCPPTALAAFYKFLDFTGDWR